MHSFLAHSAQRNDFNRVIPICVLNIHFILPTFFSLQSGLVVLTSLHAVGAPVGHRTVGKAVDGGAETPPRPVGVAQH